MQNSAERLEQLRKKLLEGGKISKDRAEGGQQFREGQSAHLTLIEKESMDKAVGGVYQKKFQDEIECLECFASANQSVATGLLNKVIEHQKVLLRKRSQRVYPNDYGIQVRDAWLSELSNFIKIAVMPLPLRLGDSEMPESFGEYLEAAESSFLYSMERVTAKKGLIPPEGMYFFFREFNDTCIFDQDRHWWHDKYKESAKYPPAYKYFEYGYLLYKFEDIVAAADCVVDDIIRARNGEESFLVDADDVRVEGEANQDNAGAITNGYEYEAFCAERLRSLGWDVIETNKSGDQGVDLIGTLRGVRIVFQCKFYSSPVGNGAVQEAIAGKVYEKADHGAVISNASFTKQAKQLASAADILLIHHDDLGKIEFVPASPH